MTTLLRIGGYQGAASVHTRALRVLADALQSQAAGAIQLHVTENVTALGHNSTDLFGMVEGGELDACYFASSYLVARVPVLRILDLPFLVGDRERAYRALDGALGQALAREVASRTPFAVLAWWDNGFRHFTNRLRPLRTPADCAGLAIRSMDNALHQAFYRVLGMNPRFIDVKDFPGAVARHEVDAQENPLTNTVNFKVYETHRFVSMTGHYLGMAPVLVNRQRFEALAPAARDALHAAIHTVTQQQRAFACAEDDQCLARLREAGVHVLAPDEIDRAAFVDATRALVERETAHLDPRLLGSLRA